MAPSEFVARRCASSQGELPDLANADPHGSVEAMEKRLDATLGSVRTVQPAPEKFYNSLSDEQKARFNSLRSISRSVG